MTRRPPAWAALAALLAALSLGAPLVNAGAGPPRALFLRLPEGVPPPRIALSAARAPDGDWLLTIVAEHFRFTSLCLANPAVAPVGHAHVFSAGVKVASAFGPVVDLGRLAPGRHDFRVVLRAQDHRVLVGPEGVIAADISIAAP